jgi:hypothetical protein
MKMSSLNRFGVISAAVVSIGFCWGQGDRGTVAESFGFGADETLSPRFRTFYVTWGDTEKPEFARYLEEVRPDVVQAGWYGPMFHGFVYQKQSTGYPMRLPVANLSACWEQWREMHGKVRANGGKSVAHFTVTNVIRGPEKDDESKPGFFADWYMNGWTEIMLGERPAPDWTDLVSKDASGKVLIDHHYVQYNSLCVNNPATRTMLKQMMRAALRNGADGFMTTYNYRRACACVHCQEAFRAHLKRTFSQQEMERHFGIADIDRWKFEKIPGQTPGYPAEGEGDPLTLASFQWSAMAYKAAWDEIFLGEGRGAKPDLILGQWDHLGNVGVTEERGFLPIASFAKGENYLWYSGNHYNPDAKPGDDNDGWLNGLYLRALAGDKPYVMGRYDSVRIRVGQAEAMALGGAGTGLNNTVTDPAAYAVLKRNLGFAKAHEGDVLDAHIRAVPGKPAERVQPVMLADTCLVIPRQSAWAGKRRSFDTFRKVGTELVRRQQRILMMSDEVLGGDASVAGDLAHRKDIVAGGGLGKFRVVILPEVLALAEDQVRALDRWMGQRPDNRLIIIGDAATLDNRGRPWAIAGTVDGRRRMAWASAYGADRVVRVDVDSLGAEGMDWGVMRPLSEPALDLWVERSGARVPMRDANSLRVSLYRHPDGAHVLHVVNYARDLAKAKQLKKANPDAEFPIVSEPLWVRIPKGGEISATKSRILTPDVREDGSPEEVERVEETDEKGARWIKLGPVTVYRILEMR